MSPPPPPPPTSDELPPSIDELQSPVQEPVDGGGSMIPPGQPGSEVAPAEATASQPAAEAAASQAESISCAEACAGVEEVIADLPPDLPPVPDSLPPETEVEPVFDELPPDLPPVPDSLPPESEVEPTFDEPTFDELPPEAGGDPSMVIPPGQPGSAEPEAEGLVDLDPEALASCASEMRDVCSGYEQVAADIAVEPGAVGAELLEELRRTLQMLVEELSLDAADLDQRGSVASEPETPVAAPWVPSSVQAVPPSFPEPASSAEVPMRSPVLEGLIADSPAAEPVDLEEFVANSPGPGMSTLDAIALGSFIANGQGLGTYTPSSIT